ncbi:MAG: cob(I)yrinic acid a,c-diamide adenosyltransferase [Gammaproteobacteria bacterium]|jgi:cob(I)alamin adenosyltransferase
MENKIDQKHKQKMQLLKSKVDASIAAATIKKGVGILLTGDGKGKSSSALGMALRSLGYGYKVGIVQFIKGAQPSGEAKFFSEIVSNATFYQMGTGFTWETQDRSKDIKAAEASWEVAAKMLSDDAYHLVILDELTYMLSFGYLDEERVIKALTQRPKKQSVVVTGRGGGKALKDWADTVSEVRDIKHAFNSGIMALEGVDF